MYDVLLITGAAGTGKTSTAIAWASSRHEITAHLSHDTILGSIKSGLASPAEQTTAEAERQWRIALDICIAAARIYASAHSVCDRHVFLTSPSSALAGVGRSAGGFGGLAPIG
jgi:hypothetical protein